MPRFRHYPRALSFLLVVWCVEIRRIVFCFLILWLFLLGLGLFRCRFLGGIFGCFVVL
jgi:hypothetical protein